MIHHLRSSAHQIRISSNYFIHYFIRRKAGVLKSQLDIFCTSAVKRYYMQFTV